MWSSAQRFIVFILSFLLCFLTFTNSASAQTNLYSNTNADVPKNLHTWTQNVFIEVVSALTCQLAGIDPINPTQACLGIDYKTGKIGYVKNGNGAIGFMGQLIAITLTPAIHTSDYTNYLAQNFGLVKPSYAQGVGFLGLNPILGLWTKFRDITYLFLVAVFAVIGFAIMLRIKIDPRTVMSISNQLPKIIVALLLITFSFAISGFLIDLMYVGSYLAVNTIADADSKPNSTVELINKDFYTPPIGFVNNLYNDPGTKASGPLGGILAIAGNASGGIKDIILNLFSPTKKGFWENIVVGQEKAKTCGDWWNFGCNLGEALGGTIGSLLSSIMGWLISFVIGILAFIIIVVALLWALFRLWFQLLTAYIFIIIDVVFAPFWIIAGIIPGSPIGFSAWLRDIISNISVFPVTIVMFTLGKVFIDNFSAPGSGSFFVPPLIGNPNVTNSLGSIIGLGIILITPQVTAMMKDILKAPTFKYAAGIGQALNAGASIPMNAGKSTLSAYTASKTAVYKMKGPGGADKGYYAGGTLGAIKSLFKI